MHIPITKVDVEEKRHYLPEEYPGPGVYYNNNTLKVMQVYIEEDTAYVMEVGHTIGRHIEMFPNGQRHKSEVSIMDITELVKACKGVK